MKQPKSKKKSNKKISRKVGLPPGVLVHVGEQKAGAVKCTRFEFTPEKYSHESLSFEPKILNPQIENSVLWLNIDGLHDIDAISTIGQYFGLHQLLQEDILNTEHRPKAETYAEHIFVTLKMLSIDEETDQLKADQLSVVFGKSWVLSFQELESDWFNELRVRIRERQGTLYARGADYLFYRLIDTTVDHYFEITDYITDTAEALEQTVLEQADLETLQQIQRLKKMIIEFRKHVGPLREVLLVLQRDEAGLFDPNTRRYLSDLQEHITHIYELIEIQRETLSGIMELYLTGVNNRMNQVMKVLTVISTIFIPLSFIVGVYGMNFDNMPELHWKYGYFIVWCGMIGGVATMLYYFRRRRWL